MTTIATQTLTRDLPNGTRVVGIFKIARVGNNAHPHFSATGEVYEKHGTWSGAAQQRNGREPDICGCIHDELLRAFPQMREFIAMHLSDYPSGLPMHAKANAAYHSKCGDDDQAATLLRCKVSDLPEVEDGDDYETIKALYSEFVDAQAERFAREANSAALIIDQEVAA